MFLRVDFVFFKKTKTKNQPNNKMKTDISQNLLETTAERSFGVLTRGCGAGVALLPLARGGDALCRGVSLLSESNCFVGADQSILVPGEPRGQRVPARTAGTFSTEGIMWGRGGRRGDSSCPPML